MSSRFYISHDVVVRNFLNLLELLTGASNFKHETAAGTQLQYEISPSRQVNFRWYELFPVSQMANLTKEERFSEMSDIG